MNYYNTDFNDVHISGFINNIIDTENKYVKFSITAKKYYKNDNNKVYVSLNISNDLYCKYKDYFFKGNKVYVKGYLNSYILNNVIKSFVTVTDISDNSDELINGKSAPHIRYDADGVMVWNGKRCEEIPTTEEEKEELRAIINSVINERNDICKNNG